MRKVIAIVACSIAVGLWPTIAGAQTETDSLPAKAFAGRIWTMSELDTLSGHKWVWIDKSFKEVVPEAPDISQTPTEEPLLRKQPAIGYPKAARESGVDAVVRLRVLIDRNGKARTAYILEDSGYEDLDFEETAIEAMKQNRWEPALLNDTPVSTWVTFATTFHFFMTSKGMPITRVDKWNWSVPSPELTSDESPADSLSAAKTPQPDDFVNVEEWPTPLDLPAPKYPRTAVQSGEEGSVWVKVLIDTKGAVRDAMVVKPSGVCVGCGFEEAALKAAVEAKWKPARYAGKPIMAWVSYEIRFRMR